MQYVARTPQRPDAKLPTCPTCPTCHTCHTCHRFVTTKRQTPTTTEPTRGQWHRRIECGSSGLSHRPRRPPRSLGDEGERGGTARRGHRRTYFHRHKFTSSRTHAHTDTRTRAC